MPALRDRLTVSVAAATGAFMVVQYFVNAAWSDGVYRTLLDWMQIIFAASLVVGVISVLRNHLSRAISKPQERWYSLILIVSALAMSLLGFAFGAGRGSSFLWAFDHLQAPMQSTVFSLLAFYIASAAFRGFRARSGESAILLAAAFIVLVARVPLGESLSGHASSAADWIVNVPALAAKRAMLIGIGLGMVATALKVIAGVERTYMGRR
ncbi:MAG: hypothetical protein HY304_05845 [candidate division Zixibacteria bacterium]|nr:hypothetical protein [candidate division Zixibacteria bacterium]